MVERVGLVAGTTGIAEAAPLIHTAILVAKVRPPLAPLPRCGAFRLTDIVPCAVTGRRKRILLTAIRTGPDTSAAAASQVKTGETSPPLRSVKVVPMATPRPRIAAGEPGLPTAARARV